MILDGMASQPNMYSLRANCKLMYLDDNKLSAGTDEHMISRDIQMVFGLDKCLIEVIRQDHREPHARHSVGDFHVRATKKDLYKYLVILALELVI